MLELPDVVFTFFSRQLPEVSQAQARHRAVPHKLTTLWALLKRKDGDLSIFSGPASGSNQVGQGSFSFLPATGLKTTVL